MLKRIFAEKLEVACRSYCTDLILANKIYKIVFFNNQDCSLEKRSKNMLNKIKTLQL